MQDTKFDNEAESLFTEAHVIVSLRKMDVLPAHQRHQFEEHYEGSTGYDCLLPNIKQLKTTLINICHQ